jgi:hypothetical protein
MLSPYLVRRAESQKDCYPPYGGKRRLLNPGLRRAGTRYRREEPAVKLRIELRQPSIAGHYSLRSSFRASENSVATQDVARRH